MCSSMLAVMFAKDRTSSRGRRLLPVGLGVALMISSAASASQGKDIFGWVEHVLVGKTRLSMKAKLDTGAETSSLDALEIKKFRRSGKRWVEFVVADSDAGRRVSFKKPLLREVRIKRHDGRSQLRPVVAIEICLGDHLKRVQVSLTDRSEFLYPVLLGRRALEGIAVVDPELSLTSIPGCREQPEHEDAS